MEGTKASVVVSPLRSGQGGQSDRFRREVDEDLLNAHPGGTRQGKRLQGCSRIGRSPRTPSNIIRREKQQIQGLKELGFGEDKK